MEQLKIEKTKTSPMVDFNAESGHLELSGRSIPEDSFSFYNPLLEWLREYAEQAKEKTHFKIYLEYFNTSASKYILEILKVVKKIADTTLTIEWCYDEGDDEMMETGEDYEDIIGLEFVYSEIEE